MQFLRSVCYNSFQVPHCLIRFFTNRAKSVILFYSEVFFLNLLSRNFSLVDMGITPHIPTQNRTCAINAYGFSLYISYSTCKTNLLICAYYIKITFLVSYVSFKVSKKAINTLLITFLITFLNW